MLEIVGAHAPYCHYTIIICENQVLFLGTLQFVEWQFHKKFIWV